MKKKIPLKNIINFKVGENLTRSSTERIPKELIYSAEDMENDLNQITTPSIDKIWNGLVSTQEGDLILALVSNKAAIVTRASVNKGLKNTMARCELIDGKNIIDPWYFCYFINESSEFKIAKASGLIGAARVLTIAELTNFEIKLPSLSTQKKIGKIYKTLCRLNYLRNCRTTIINKIFYATTKKIIKRENKNEYRN